MKFRRDLLNLLRLTIVLACSSALPAAAAGATPAVEVSPAVSLDVPSLAALLSLSTVGVEEPRPAIPVPERLLTIAQRLRGLREKTPVRLSRHGDGWKVTLKLRF